MEATTTLAHHDESEHRPGLARFGMLVFLASEAMLFAGLIGAYIVLRIGEGAGWVPEGAPNIGITFPPNFMNVVMLLNTVILVSSSFTYHWAEAAIKKGQSGLGWMVVTSLFGAIFLGVQAYEWLHLKHLGMWFDTYGVYGSCFFVLTGFHGLHVFIGLLFVIGAMFRSFKREMALGRGESLSGEVETFEECTGLYWHFVDVVWVFLFAILYLV